MPIVSQDGSVIRRRAFYSPEIFEDELDRIFQHTWQFVGHESEVAEQGDYVQRVLGTDRVIVTRDEDGEIHVLQNACRHRGAILCGADSGNTSHFRCSYHGWTFANDGKLRGVPHAKALYKKNPLDRSKHSLTAARVAVMYGLIFATWDMEGPSFEEYVGDAAWYLQAIFDKDLEVMGAPTRIRGHHNWKAAAENMTPDNYHAPVTHKLVMDLGVALNVDLALKEAHQEGAGNFLPEQANPEKQHAQIVLDNGHSLVTWGGLKFERPAFLGYEGHLWQDFASRLTKEQIDFEDGLVITVGNLFPTFSWVEQFFTELGTKRAGVKFINVRTWVPISPTETEQYTWCLVPKNASAEWKEESQATFLRGLGVAGMLEIDDLNNWTGMAQTGTGAIGQDTPNNMSAVVSVPATSLSWPGRVYTAELDDIGFRNFYAEWARRMGFSGPELEKSWIPDELAEAAK
jgi:phenylpropionate dioxygenase-like ring-hydroxylating dioxygenase large terminal subunit